MFQAAERGESIEVIQWAWFCGVWGFIGECYKSKMEGRTYEDFLKSPFARLPARFTEPTPLTEGERAIFILIHVDRHSVRWVAKHLRMTRKAVKSVLRHAGAVTSRKTFRRILRIPR